MGALFFKLVRPRVKRRAYRAIYNRLIDWNSNRVLRDIALQAVIIIAIIVV